MNVSTSLVSVMDRLRGTGRYISLEEVKGGRRRCGAGVMDEGLKETQLQICH